MSISVLLLEDDPFTSDWIRKIVHDHFGPLVRIVQIKTEKEFLIRLPSIQELDPELRAIVLDARLPWEDDESAGSHSEMNPAGDASEAGIRIHDRIRSQSALANLPILFYTVNDLERISLPGRAPHFEYMRKDEPDERFIDWIERSCLTH